MPWLENPANTHMRHTEHWTAVSTLLCLINSAYDDLHHYIYIYIYTYIYIYIYILLLKRSNTPKCFDSRCNLCLEEKMHILLYPEPEKLLNKRCELIARCRHRAKFKL